MEIFLRDMLPAEAPSVRTLARKSFTSLERLFLPKPSAAMLAMAGDEIVGACSYKTWVLHGGQKVGYLETGFIKKGWEGQSIGSTLYENVSRRLLADGCTAVTALVRDDNVASWHAMEKCGFSLLSFSHLFHLYGLLGCLRVWFSSYLCILPGFRLWGTAGTGSGNAFGRFFAYLALNFLLLLPAFFYHSTSILPMLGALACLLLIPLACTRLLCLLDKHKWHFDIARGGILPTFLVSCFGGFFPLVGHMYPAQYANSPVFRQSMGSMALVQWATIFALTGLGFFLKFANPFFHYLAIHGMFFLLYYSLPFDPFGCFGGRRIWDWNHMLSLLIIGFSALPALVYFW